jgi:hypothetical protein
MGGMESVRISSLGIEIEVIITPRNRGNSEVNIAQGEIGLE